MRILVRGVFNSWETLETNDVFCIASIMFRWACLVSNNPPRIIEAKKMTRRRLARIRNPFSDSIGNMPFDI